MRVETIVTWKWRKPGYRSTFTAEHVNVARDMVARHYKRPHRFVCVTDDPAGLDPRIEVQSIGDLWADIPNPSWPAGPSCYRRLALFASDAEQRFGRRFVSIDLDVVITGDLMPVWERPEPIVLWSDPNFHPKGMYCGSMILLSAGAAPEIYETFDPLISPRQTRAAGCMGSDQGWLSYKLGRGRPVWTTADGVYSFWVHLEKRNRRLPADARIVFFHGHRDSWHADVQAQHPWVREHWRCEFLAEKTIPDIQAPTIIISCPPAFSSPASK
jgi:hypothetical protein